MYFTHFRNSPIHKIFSCNIKTAWKMISFLITSQSFINCTFNWAGLPINCPVIWFCLLHILKPIILQSITDYLNVVLMQIKIIPTISWYFWFHQHWVFKWPKHQILLSHLVQYYFVCCIFNLYLLLLKRCIFSFKSRGIRFLHLLWLIRELARMIIVFLIERLSCDWRLFC